MVETGRFDHVADLPGGWIEKCRAFCRVMPERVDQYMDLLAKNEIVLQRLRHVCPLPEAELLALGVTGPLRGDGYGSLWDDDDAVGEAALLAWYDTLDRSEDEA